MALQFELAGAQIDGSRDYQEDAFLITHLTDKNGNPSALIIVADGMGGHAAGNVASNMAVQAFNKHVSANYPTDNPAEILHECVIKANNSIKETVKETPALAGMGCTMVAAILEAGKLWWASVGDSHLYLVRNNELIKKNADHSYGGFLDRMAAAGTPVEPEPGLARNMLMSAVTGDEINEIDAPEEPFELQAGDRIMLCSDGIDTLSTGKIIQFSGGSESPKECVDALLNAVNEAAMPKQDNTTVVAVNVVEKAQASAAVTPAQEGKAGPQATPASPGGDNGKSSDEPRPGTVAPEAQPPTPPPPPPVQQAPQEPKKGNTGLIIGIAAIIIIAIAAGAFMLFNGKKPASPTMADDTASSIEDGGEPPAIAETAPVPEEKEIALNETTDSSPVKVPPEETKPSAEKAQEKKATATTGGKEFHDTLKDGSLGPAMIWVPAGSFDMGSPGSSRYAEERPRHTVTVNKFAMSKYEITFAQYDKFAKETGRKIPDNLYLDRETHPVIFVSWDDAFYYSKWLSKQTGKNYRLPSEAEWEYAAGAGKRSTFWWGFNEEPGKAHCFGCGSAFDPRKPTKVGSFSPNPFGIYDTAGNVAEWTYDCWHENYKDAPSKAVVWEGGDCAYRIARGGAYSSPPQSIRHTKRDKFKSDSEYDHIGIRLVRDPD